MIERRLDILLIAPNCDGHGCGRGLLGAPLGAAHERCRQCDAADAVAARPHAGLSSSCRRRASSSGRSRSCRAASSACRAMLKPGYPAVRGTGPPLDRRATEGGSALRHHPPADAAGAALCLTRLRLRHSLCSRPACRKPRRHPKAFAAECRSAPLFTQAARDRPLPAEADPWLRTVLRAVRPACSALHLMCATCWAAFRCSASR